MGTHDIKLQGYPRSHLKRDWSLEILCGGKGGGGGAVSLSQTYCKYAIDVNPYITLNRELTLVGEINIYSGTDVYGDGITPQPWYLATAATNTLTAAQIIAQGNKLQSFETSGTDVYELFRNKLPQPSNPGWASKIWVYIYWGTPGWYGDFDYIDNLQWLIPNKHDFDVRQ